MYNSIEWERGCIIRMGIIGLYTFVNDRSLLPSYQGLSGTVHLIPGVSAFPRPGATFTLVYQLASRKVVNEDILLKLRGNLLKMLLNYANCGKQVDILFRNFL
jgi:hypothetical protein